MAREMPRPENRLLTALPRRVYTRLLGELTPVPLAFGQILGQPHERASYVYFPRSGVISLLAVLPDDTTAEVGMVGSEGMADLALFLGSGRSPFRMLVQVPGEALRMRTQDLERAMRACGALHWVLLRYVQALLTAIRQATACNLLHSAEQRLRRWLLMIDDRVPGGRFPITQQFLAAMLALNRSRLSVLAGRIQREGQIRYRRGKMTILDRPGLEARVCACYGVVRQEFEQVLGWPTPAPGSSG